MLWTIENFIDSPLLENQFGFRKDSIIQHSICVTLLIILEKWKCAVDKTKLQHFSNDAFQSYYDLFQVNWLVQIQRHLYKSS